MPPGELLTRWTVRVAMALYFAALIARLGARGRASWLATARWTWTFGLLAFLVHVACAFHFVHGWSHQAAYVETARQTQELFGLDWGGGLYFNYLFTVVWGIDVAWWWHDDKSYLQRPRWLEGMVQGFLAFMAFNAVIVFGQGPIRWWGLGACVVLGACAIFRRSG